MATKYFFHLVLILLLVNHNIKAQFPVPIEDNAKRSVLRSMETGPWQFEPESYFYSFYEHKVSVLGFSFKINKWPGFGFHDKGPAGMGGGDNYVNEYAPNSTQRAAMLGVVLAEKKIRESIQKVYDEAFEKETIEFTDLNVNLAKTNYTDKFSKLENQILDNISALHRIGNTKLISDDVKKYKEKFFALRERKEIIDNAKMPNSERTSLYFKTIKALKKLDLDIKRSYIFYKYMIDKQPFKNIDIQL